MTMRIDIVATNAAQEAGTGFIFAHKTGYAAIADTAAVNTEWAHFLKPVLAPAGSGR